jgi:DNA polymerase III delta prime subunit
MTTRGSQQYSIITSWLDSSEAEAPYLLLAERQEMLDEFVQVLNTGMPHGLEVVQAFTEAATITIDQVRALFASITTRALGRRLVVIPAAERLSGPASSVLLKRLEEPSSTTRFLLTTVYPRRLLPTITSRCQRLRLDRVGEPAQADDEFSRLALDLASQLRRDGPNRELRRAFQRLRDYHQIVSMRGNEKLAREVLFASLPPSST